MKRISRLYQICKTSRSNFVLVSVKYFYHLAKGKNIISHQKKTILGFNIIALKGMLKVGVDSTGFTHHKDAALLNVRGKLDIGGNFSIGRGCRLDIGPEAVVTLGGNTYINPFANIIIMHKLNIGENCAISWNCQFLDEDFHQITYKGQKKASSPAISIGNKVCIGSKVSIYKGTVILNGCVIASNSVVKGTFDAENVLIAGNPAKIIKRNISW